jgi:uncharacterized protein
MKGKGHVPIRTCVSCGSKRAKNLLTRLTLDNENHLLKDDTGRIEGRGIYVCEQRPCIERLMNNKRLNRHFRTDRKISVGHELSGIMPFDNIKQGQI